LFAIHPSRLSCEGVCKNNPRAKRWEIVSPAGETFRIEGTLKQFCEEHRLAVGILKRMRNKGPYMSTRYSKTRGLAKNTEGWEIKEL